jgi:hypothetical protein
MNEKKNKEEIVKMKAIYEKRIKTLEEELNELKDKCNKNDTTIDSLKKELLLLEKYKNEDQFKLKQFDYKNLKKIDKDPLENVNTKILLLNSLIDESNNNIKRYKENILAFNEQLKDMGYEPFDVTNLFNPENDKINIGQKKNNNNEINNDDTNDDKSEKEKINKIKENDNENNIIIKNNLDSDGNKFRVESTKEEETKNENNINIKPPLEKNNEINEQINKNSPENNDEEIRITNNNEEEDEKITNDNNGIVISSNANNNKI